MKHPDGKSAEGMAEDLDEWKALELRAKARSVARIAEALGRSVEWVNALIASEACVLRAAGRLQAANAIEVGIKFYGGYRIREPRSAKSPARRHSNRKRGPPGFSSYAERAAAIATARIKGLTPREIAQRLGLSAERVRQILIVEEQLLRQRGEHARAALLAASRLR